VETGEMQPASQGLYAFDIVAMHACKYPKLRLLDIFPIEAFFKIE
jgi:hypothetical protein